MTRPRAARRGMPARMDLARLRTGAIRVRVRASEGALAAVLDEPPRIVDPGLFPFGGGRDVARSRAMRHMGLEPAGERDVGLERDAGDRPVGRRGDLEP